MIGYRKTCGPRSRLQPVFPRNLRDMKRFYLAYTAEAIWRQPVAKLAGSTASGGLLIRRRPAAELESYEKRLQGGAKVRFEVGPR